LALEQTGQLGFYVFRSVCTIKSTDWAKPTQAPNWPVAFRMQACIWTNRTKSSFLFKAAPCLTNCATHKNNNVNKNESTNERPPIQTALPKRVIDRKTCRPLAWSRSRSAFATAMSLATLKRLLPSGLPGNMSAGTKARLRILAAHALSKQSLHSPKKARAAEIACTESAP
jgi:hypothetical protein